MRIAVLAGAFALLLASGNAFALRNDQTQPIDITADRINLNQRTGFTTYNGHVVLVQGSLHIHADKVIASYLRGAVQQVNAYGRPVRFREQPKRGAPEIVGSALHLTYDASRHLLELHQHVTLHQGRNSMTGASIRYNLITQQLSADGSAEEGRVHTVIVPDKARQRTRKQ